MVMENDQPVTLKTDDLFKAAENGNVSVFKSLSESQLPLRNDDGRSLLHVAVSSAHLEINKINECLD
ncbi:26S proteasome non-ATPase regulatory subunit 10 [Artemisia annua]|uniref:26S proteasome non-ATPase regulatory subunit 10 n=1 Tax=Artemisia annua TaxID=35608 RepID=A0A2U1NMX0_ARTAN|nr:26S proteasome non-ATPase regulatory subunit 10 [Artemisia annua]